MRRFVLGLILALAVLALFAVSASAAGFVPAPGSPFSSLGQGPISLALPDLDRDGTPDVVVSNGLPPQSFGVLLSDGGGRLAPGSPVFPTLGATGELAPGDFNGDGSADVAVCGTIRVRVLLGDGAGGLRALSYGSAELGCGSLRTGDFDRNGTLDVVVADGTGPQLWILLNDGAGNLTPSATSPIPAGPSGLSVGDFNADGSLDVATNVRVFLGDGAGGLSAAPGSPLNTGDSAAPLGVDTADFNRDGRLDLAVLNNNSNLVSRYSSVAILLGDGNGGFRLSRGSPSYSTVCCAGDLAVGDFNGDGKTDVATVGHTDLRRPTESDDAVAVWLGNDRGGLREAPGSPYRSVGATGLAAADLNGDGKADLVTTNFYSDSVSVLLSDLKVHGRGARP